MQPQDQNYQADDQTVQPVANDDQDINSEQLESAPSQENSSSQTPPAPAMDNYQNDIPDVPMINSQPTLNNQPEMEHLPEPPAQLASDSTISDEPKPQLDVADMGIDEQLNSQDQQFDDLSSQTMSSDENLETTPQVEQAPSVISESIEPTVSNQPEGPAVIDSNPVIEEAQTSAPQFNESSLSEDQVATESPIVEPQDQVDTTTQPEISAPENSFGVNQPTESSSSTNQEPTVPATPETQPSVEVNEKVQPPMPPQPPTERVSLTDRSSFEPQEPKAIANDTVATPEEKENIYTEICSEIIKEQEQIIGTLAVEQANYVEGLTVDAISYHCTVTGDGSKVIDDLIEQYRDFFGHAAVEVCKEAASRFLARLPAEELPTSLR